MQKNYTYMYVQPSCLPHAGVTTTDGTTTLVGDPGLGGGGGEENYTGIIVAVSVPCGLVILTLIIIIAFIIFLTVRAPR